MIHWSPITIHRYLTGYGSKNLWKMVSFQCHGNIKSYFYLQYILLEFQLHYFIPAKTISVCLSETVKLKGKVTSPDSSQNLLSNLELEKFPNHSEMMAVRRTFVKVVGRNVLSQHTNGGDWLCL